ncbi:Hypothetical predicted protein [Paramuricea clavata]|uniref:Uncharacterized protein n=1 Tax=Paramuricea clavata TaxID=317549 RepID=A0A7D9EMD1_PARCT|nr:Hypothetical predicted protein [Paramuricea clavata]
MNPVTSTKWSNLVSRNCPLLKYWLNEKRMHPYHVTYMSRCSQNEFIKLIGDAVPDRVVKELEEAPAFSVMADTTPDVSNKDQMSIVVSLGIMRFIMRHCKVLVVQFQEEGLNLLDAHSLFSTTAKALEGIRNETDVDNQVKAAAAMARQVGCEPEKEFSQHDRKRVPSLRLDDRRGNKSQILERTSWNRVFANIKPLSVLQPP